MVNVTEIGEMGAYVTLLEYDDIEVYYIHSAAFIPLTWLRPLLSFFLRLSQGMILLSELSRRRIRSINKLVRVNRTEIVMVIRVDKEKGK